MALARATTRDPERRQFTKRVWCGNSPCEYFVDRDGKDTRSTVDNNIVQTTIVN